MQLEIKLNNDTRLTVDAWQFGAFAVHRDPRPEPDDTPDWCATHIRTGVAVPALFDCFDRAAAAAQFLNAALLLGDFTDCDSEEYKAFKVRARRIIDGINAI